MGPGRGKNKMYCDQLYCQVSLKLQLQTTSSVTWWGFGAWAWRWRTSPAAYCTIAGVRGRSSYADRPLPWRTNASDQGMEMMGGGGGAVGVVGQESGLSGGMRCRVRASSTGALAQSTLKNGMFLEFWYSIISRESFFGKNS